MAFCILGGHTFTTVGPCSPEKGAPEGCEQPTFLLASVTGIKMGRVFTALAVALRGSCALFPSCLGANMRGKAQRRSVKASPPHYPQAPGSDSLALGSSTETQLTL